MLHKKQIEKHSPAPTITYWVEIYESYFSSLVTQKFEPVTFVYLAHLMTTMGKYTCVLESTCFFIEKVPIKMPILAKVPNSGKVVCVKGTDI